jgi:hypothetical protein
LATFEEQVEGITGLTIGSSPAPSSNVFTDMLREGVRDVVNKMIVLRPEEIPKFTATTDSGAGTSVAKTGKILSVMREHASTSILRKCTLISPNTRYEATDSDSLFYRSEVNPGYYELNGSIHTVPAAAESGNNNVVVTQVTYDAGLVGGDTYGGGNISNFPTDYEHLVILYSAIQCLQAAIANSVISLNISSPTAPVLSVITFSSVDSSLDASSPIFTTASVSAASTYAGNAPNYTTQSIVPDFAKVNNYIDINQDVELASAKLQTINAQLAEMNAKMQDSMNTFNKENATYQSAIQESIQEMQAENQVNLSKAQADLQIATTNKDRDLQRQLQNATNDMQALVADNTSKVNKYSAEVNDYQAEVAKETQENTTKVQQYQLLYGQLSQQYISAFQVAQPQQAAQPERRR